MPDIASWLSPFVGQLYPYVVFLCVIGLLGFVLYKFGQHKAKDAIEKERMDHEMSVKLTEEEIERYVKSRTSSELDDLI